MNIFQSILLGIIQGITEFLPVSSSAHLIIFPFLMNWHIPAAEAFVFDVLVQVATLIGVLAYFWKDLISIGVHFIQGIITRQPFAHPQARLGWFLIIGTLPAGFLGLALKNQIEAAFGNPQNTAWFLMGTAILLFIAEKVGKRLHNLEHLTWLDALIIGGFQAMAIFPGVSRSGATITGGMVRNLERPAAARFSFLLSIPIMLAAGLLASLDLLKTPGLTSQLPVMIPGFILAAITGYLAIRWLIGFLMRHPLYVFSYYRVALGLLTLYVAYIRK
jgi:undecaprenyl-diphosphatase